MNMNGKTVVITGAAQGLGAAMAMHFATHSARLALIDVNLAKLEAVRSAVTRLGAEARSYQASVASEEDVTATYEKIAKDFGALDVAIANAGILRDGLLLKAKNGNVTGRLDLASWQSVIDVNLTGVFLCGREAAAQMIGFGQPGVIINISSISRQGNFGQTNYSAAKAGVAAMTVVWAKELARHAIRSNAIAPGFIETEILSGMKPEVLEKIAGGIPAGRLGTPAEIASTAQFIIENDYVNGRIIEVDGGLRL
jgi:3-oxoacyl-[acyl-carrier protein] reductase